MAYPITATFIDDISYDIPSSNWSDDDWRRELDIMKSVGIDTLVFIRGGLGDKMIYPSEKFYSLRKNDFPKLIFTEAAKRGMDVYMGMYISEISWNYGDYETEIKQNRIFTKEVCQRYGDMPSFKGWYIPHETSLNIWNISEVMSGLSYMCKEITPEKKVLISPFFYSSAIASTEPGAPKPLEPDDVFEVWDEILEKVGPNIDICAFQDGTAPIRRYKEYFEATRKLCRKHNMEHWVNVETFERDVRCMYYPIPFDLLSTKLDMAAGLTDKAMTFEFSHFMSPQSIYPSAHNLFERYKEYYGNK